MPEQNCNIYPDCASCEQELSCFRKIAGVLSDKEVRHFNIVQGDKEGSHNPTVYDLRLGEYHYLYDGSTGDDGKAKWKAVYLGDKSLSRANKGWDDPSDRFEHLHEGGADHTKLVIPPLGAALIELYEIIDTDTIANAGILVTGRFDLKLSLVNKGLISQQGTQIEPCYKGRMYCFIHNLSGDEITLKRYQSIASIEFSYVSCFCKHEKRMEIVNALRKKNHDDERYPFKDTCNIDQGITNIRYFKQKRQLPDDCGLYSYGNRLKSQFDAIDTQVKSVVKNYIVDKDIIETIKKALSFRMELLKVIIPAIAVVIVAIITGYFTIAKPFADQSSKYDTQITLLQSQIEKLETENEELDKLISSYVSMNVTSSNDNLPNTDANLKN